MLVRSPLPTTRIKPSLRGCGYLGAHPQCGFCVEDMDDIDVPNCEVCLLPMRPSERGRAIIWFCVLCGLAKL